jgi:hypothetical protein
MPNSIKTYCLIALACSWSVVAESANNEEVFAQLKALSGNWAGTLKRSTGEEIPLQLSYSVRANDSAVVEESDEDGVAMLNIFNVQQGELVSTHYCGLMNRPVSTLTAAGNGVLSFTTDAGRSGLEEGKDEYVNSWTLTLDPANPDQFTYQYTVINADREVMTATAQVSRVR